MWYASYNEQSRRERGFSLIELLVVMAIISILSTVAVISYQKYTMNAKYSVLESELREMTVIAEETYTEKDGYPSGSCNALTSSVDVKCSVNDSLTVITGDTGSPVFKVRSRTKVTFYSSGAIMLEASPSYFKNSSRTGGAKLAVIEPDDSHIRCYDDEIHGRKWPSGCP